MVVTIVVLIILATISINAVLGENGLIARSQQAKELHDQAKTNEETALGEMDETLANYMSGISSGGNTPTDPTINWDLNKVDKIKSEDGIIVPVPKGYRASTINGEKSVSTGFVIKEGEDGSKTEGINEFVWVPVSDITDLYDEANNAGQLWDFGTSSSPKNPAQKRAYPTIQNSGYREPDTIQTDVSGSGSLSSSDCLLQAGLTSDATADDFKVQLQNEFNAMKNSVEKYGGFYIGRYETGNLSQEAAVVQKNNRDIGDQTWYTMYKVSKTVKANNNVVSSMIWGCQWDATLRWMQTSSDPKVVNYVTDSTGKGNYSRTQGATDKLIPTGSIEAYAVNNIYDMAGNVSDCTLEVLDTWYRIARDSNYGSTSTYSTLSASARRRRSISVG